MMPSVLELLLIAALERVLRRAAYDAINTSAAADRCSPVCFAVYLASRSIPWLLTSGDALPVAYVRTH